MSASDVVELTSALVAINSANPALEAGGAGEAAAAAFVADWARGAELDVELLERTPGRPSVLVRAPGSGGGRSLLLCGHLDTVGAGAMEDPFEPRIDGDRLRGRGSYDMKAGVAAALVACREAAAADLAGDVVVAAVADEEHASIGVREALGVLRADAAIVTEPTGLRVCVAHKGFVWAELETEGRAAHGSRPAEGVDAITRMAPALARLAELQSVLDAQAGHELVGPGSVHASLIEGGQELSSYPARCRLALERRTAPGESADHFRAECEALIEGIDGAELRMGLVRPPFAVDPEEPVVQAVRRAAASVTGEPADPYGETYWMDAALIQAAGIPTVVFGPDGWGAHAVDEWVDLASVDACSDVLVAAAHELCA
jgi:acetylornithine deacetylase